MFTVISRELLKSFFCCESGIAYVEFVISSTALLILFFGSIEVTRYVLIVQKIEKTVTSIADVVAETNPNSGGVSDTGMSQLLSSVTDMMSPYTLGMSDPNIRIIVTDILYDTTTSSPTTPIPTINWQYCGGGGGTQGSHLYSSTGYNESKGATACLGLTPCSGAAGAGLPTSFTGSLDKGEEFIVAEVFYNFTPISNQRFYQPVSTSALLYRTAVYMPRLGALTTFVPVTGTGKTTTCP